MTPVLLSRRQLLAALAGGAAALAGSRLALAGPGPIDDPFRRSAMSVTAPGAPRLVDPVVLQRSDGSTYQVPLDDYVKGVVAGEMPASWPADALKAQAVAARTYSCAWMATYGAIAESNQAYVPGNRTSSTDAAVDQTRGELMLYQGGMIYAFYMSTCGGETSTALDATAAYCQSVRCWRDASGAGRAPLDLSSEPAAAGYWGNQNPSQPAFCSPSTGNYRWSFSATASDKALILDDALSGAGSYVTPSYTRGKLGTLRDLQVAQRVSSGKITQLRVVGSGGTWTLLREADIRNALSSTRGSQARSATAVFVVNKDSTGNVTSVATSGGGWGHDTGMCQWGARGMAVAGYDYQTILRQYYSSIDFAIVGGGVVPPAKAHRVFLPLAPRKSVL